MKCAIITLLAALAIMASVSAEDFWTYYPNGTDLREIAVQGDTVWCAAAGSLVCWNSRSGEYDQFTERDGLPSHDILRVCSNGWGSVWLLCGMPNNERLMGRFDGHSWIPLDIAEDGPSNFESITDFHSDPSGILWAGTVNNGLFRYNGVSWTHFLPEEAVTTPRAMATDHDGVIWFATPSDGAFSYDGTRWKKYTPNDGLADTVVRCVAVAPDNVKWFGTTRGISRYDGVSWRTFTVKDSLAGNTVNDITFDSSGLVWAATDYGVSRFDGAVWKSWREADYLISKKVTGLAADRTGRVWLAHRSENQGVTVIEDGKVVWYTTFNSGLPSNAVHSVTCDARGVMWFALDIGAASFDGREWKRYTTNDGLLRNDLEKVSVDDQNRIWFFYTSASGATCFDGVSWKSWTSSDGIPSDLVYSVVARNGETWFSTMQGLTRFDGNSWTPFPNNDRLMTKNITGVTGMEDGTIWLATAKGLTRYDGVSWKTWDLSTDVLTVGIRMIRAGGGTVWLLDNKGGLYRFDGGQVKACPFPDGKSHYTRCIGVDLHGTVWTDVLAGSTYDQVQQVQNYQYYRSDGLSWGEYAIEAKGGYRDQGVVLVSSIIPGQGQKTWLATSRGLMRWTAEGDTWYTTNTPQLTHARDMDVDRENNLFIIDENGGRVSIFDGSAWNSTVRWPSGSLFIDDGNEKWMYTAGSGLYHSDGSTWKPEFKPEEYPFRESSQSHVSIPPGVFTIDSAGRKWFGISGKGIYCFDGTKWTNHWSENISALNDIQGIAADRDGTIWANTNTGLYRFDGVSWKSHEFENSPVNYTIVTCMEVRDGKEKWFGTNNGLIRYRDGSFESINTGKDPLIGSVNSLALDYAGILWVGTGQGVFRYDGATWKRYTKAEGLFDSSVTNLVVDRNNVKWFAHPYGLSVLDDRPSLISGKTPKELILRGNFPNPFNAGTGIAFDLFSCGNADLSIYNIMGQKVRTIHATQLTAGRNIVQWNGCDDRGVKLSSGPYFYQVRKGGEKARGRMLFVK